VRARRLTFLFLVYVSLDLSSPFIPGAFNFNPDESVDGVQRPRDPRVVRMAITTAPSPLAGPSLDSPALSANAVARRAASPVSEWLVDVRRAHAPVPEVSALSDDH
jgi:hypothetical protein